MRNTYRFGQTPRIGASLYSPLLAFVVRIALLGSLYFAGQAQPTLAQRVASAQTAPASTSASPRAVARHLPRRGRS